MAQKRDFPSYGGASKNEGYFHKDNQPWKKEKNYSYNNTFFIPPSIVWIKERKKKHKIKICAFSYLFYQVHTLPRIIASKIYNTIIITKLFLEPDPPQLVVVTDD